MPTQPTTQKQRVFEVMRDGQWRALWTIRTEILKRFHKMDSETAISARLRQLRREGYAVNTQRQGSGQAYQYQVGGCNA